VSAFKESSAVKGINFGTKMYRFIDKNKFKRQHKGATPLCHIERSEISPALAP